MFFLSDKHTGLADRRQRTLGGRTPDGAQRKGSKAIFLTRGYRDLVDLLKTRGQKDGFPGCQFVSRQYLKEMPK
jgi:hypothetical protein